MRKRRSLPDAPFVGRVTVPGDKSISHRALILSALARGTSTVRHVNTGHDVLATARTLSQLGAACSVDEDNARVEIESPGAPELSEPDDILWAGNSGTTLRSLMGVCAGIEGLSVLSGDDSLRTRPMLRVVSPLRQMGATIDGRDYGALAPIAVRGGDLQGIDFDMPVPSAQVKTAVLLAGLVASGRTSVVEPVPSRDHTERMLAAVGVPVRREGLEVSVEGGILPRARDWMVPGDVSSAAFLIAGALLLDGSDLDLEGVGLNPTRTGILDALGRMGAQIEVSEQHEDGGEPVGSLKVKASRLHATSISGDEIPRLIDELPVLAVVATQAEGVTEIRGASELRMKESDRIEVVVNSLRTLGADVESLPDGMVVRGPADLVGAEVDAHNDHRVALALAVAGFVAGGNVRIRGWSSVGTSFPEFLDVVAEARAGQ
ncbi:MAG: 3-phosphoshikimate 1-carboxyvinyltransferase [Actinomycetota bacterium]|nr:3-phosphoshikimate 1-carboxyvinyltransferase [Actinomycetota bacterium]